jgi:hypothetical protein
VAWGEKETRRILGERPWLKSAFYGLLELQLWLVPLAVRGLKQRSPDHPVISQLDGFVAHVQKRVWKQGQELGFAPRERPGMIKRAGAVSMGLLILLRSQFARSRSRLDRSYIEQLGFGRSG